MTDKLDKQVRQLAAMAFGEASSADDENEMSAIASVLVRQRDARGYTDIATFAAQEPSFSFVVSDGNARYSKVMKALEADIAKHKGMKAAVKAAINAINGGPDKSNGAYFWDGADIRSNYKRHFKVRHGIKFSDPAHNIYNIPESTKVGIVYKITKKKNAKTGQVTTAREEVGRYDHHYDSTAAYGGTIFWKFNQQFLDVTHARNYK
jgi:hypothetical protein